MFLFLKTPFFLFSTLLWSLFITTNINATTLEVGTGHPYSTLPEAIEDVTPGDTILIFSGTYSGGLFVDELQGLPDAWIYILAAQQEMVIFDGGNNAWQFTDAAYLHIHGIIFEHQLGNGVNFDDGGTYETPAHHVIFEDCTFRNINASGNNDLLKLSGIDSFEIRSCIFLNGAAGGSGIDMVGCHDGLIQNCHFENLGSNSIQAKGGTRNIRIERNFFLNGGSRAVNLGGSTGLQFFRPIDAPYEAADLKVYSNIFIGSEAAVAFVGCINTEVVNNTIFLPGKWVLRILQETVDLSRFPPCGYNTFRNNIVYLDDHVNVECNIGPNTAPETFTFSNNLWFHEDDAGWQGPNLPVTDVDQIIGDPLFEDSDSYIFTLMEGSPAIGNGYDVEQPVLDYSRNPFANPRSIGAEEGGMSTGVELISQDDNTFFKVYPNPFIDQIKIEFVERISGEVDIHLTTIEGKAIKLFKSFLSLDNMIEVPIGELPKGSYFLHVISNEKFNNLRLIVGQ